MFSIFKKKKQDRSIPEIEYVLLEKVTSGLPNKYSFLKNQINRDFILGALPNVFLGNGWKTLLYNQKLYDTIVDKNINYKLSGIRVYDSELKTYQTIQLDICNGILIGYQLEKNENNLDNINYDNIYEKLFVNEDEETLLSIIGIQNKAIESHLDLQDTFKLELEEGEFYTIKNMGNGDYVAVNKNREVYLIIHDPYEVEKIFDSVNDFFNSLKADSLSIDKYYENKML